MKVMVLYGGNQRVTEGWQIKRRFIMKTAGWRLPPSKRPPSTIYGDVAAK